jgi:ankyrin repeat protein
VGDRLVDSLHEAASTGDLAMVELLLSLGADPIDRPVPVTEPDRS